MADRRRQAGAGVPPALGHGTCGRTAESEPAGRGAEQRERGVPGRPAERLHARRRPRLEQERIADQRQHRREVRQREQAVGRRRREAPREPRLHERAGRRQQEVRQPDRHREHAEDEPRRVLVADGLPAFRGNDRQHHEARDEQRDVQHDRAPRRELPHRPVGVRVAGEERGLEEHEARGPDGRRSAEPRQDLLRHHRLHQEQQERGQEDRGGVEDHRVTRAYRRLGKVGHCT